MEITTERVTGYDKDLITLLFQKAGEGKNTDPNPWFFSDPHNILLVAYANREPAGFLYAYTLPGLKTPYPKMFLYSIDVFRDYRRQGIAGRLIIELKKLAKENRCSEIFVMTNQSNGPAMELYTKTGGRVANGDDILFVYDRETLPHQ